jgi:hypothetical protein
MNSTQLYQWEEEIAKHFNSLNSWQIVNVALLSYGIARAESCQQQKVARKLCSYGKWESTERRFQRMLANSKFDVSQACREWIVWIWEAMGCPQEWTVLVDETKLGNHLGVMMLGVAYEGRCIPLVWHCYHPKDYPRCGQVSLILNLLLHVKKALAEYVDVLILADRGIGTSPQLCRYIDDLLGWRYLFRVTCQSKIVSEAGDYAIAKMVKEGQIWCASGKVFKKRGKIPAHARAIWSLGYDEPWALVTNDEQLTGFEYAARNWQEQSFRDLKSGGWQWDTSHIWIPSHARRLIFLMALAYAWMIALGAQVFQTEQHARPKRFKGRCERRYSIFREGLHHFQVLIDLAQAIRVWFCFYELPPKPPD